MKYRDWLFGKDGALFRAAARGNTELVRELVARGANVNVSSRNGFTPLHRAAQRGHEAVVRFLLESGVRPDAAASDNSTPISLATESGQREIVKLLNSRM